VAGVILLVFLGAEVGLRDLELSFAFVTSLVAAIVATLAATLLVSSAGGLTAIFVAIEALFPDAFELLLVPDLVLATARLEALTLSLVPVESLAGIAVDALVLAPGCFLDEDLVVTALLGASLDGRSPDLVLSALGDAFLLLVIPFSSFSTYSHALLLISSPALSRFAFGDALLLLVIPFGTFSTS